MAQNTTVNLTAATWTQLTDADVSKITFQNISSYYVLIKVTAGATPPSSLAGVIRYNPGQGERNVLLADIAPGVSGGNRVYAYAPDGAAVTVSNA